MRAEDPAYSTAFPQPSALSKGDVTMTQKASGYSGGAFSYQTASRTAYDSYGRPVTAFDANGNKTTTSYTGTDARSAAPGLAGLPAHPACRRGLTIGVAWRPPPAKPCDTIAGMAWGEAELEPEVRDWLEALDDQHPAARRVLTRQLSGKLRELRFYCGGQ